MGNGRRADCLDGPGLSLKIFLGMKVSLISWPMVLPILEMRLGLSLGFSGAPMGTAGVGARCVDF